MKLKKASKPVASKDVEITCLLVNSVEFCTATTKQLEKRLKELVDPHLTESISFETSFECSIACSSYGLALLASLITSRAFPAFQAMRQTKWSLIRSVGDHSRYVSLLHDLLHHEKSVPLIACLLNSSLAYSNFCNRLIYSLTEEFRLAIFECKPITEIAAEQLLIDMQAIRQMLSRIDKYRTAEILEARCGPIECILKSLLCSSFPPDDFVRNYLLLTENTNADSFRMLLELKGIEASGKKKHGILANSPVGNPEFLNLMESFGSQSGARD